MAQQFLSKTMPIVVFAVVVIATVGVAGFLALSSQARPVGTSAVSDPSALELHIAVYPDPYYVGAQAYSIDAWEFNPLSVTNNVTTVPNWAPPAVFVGGCDSAWPMGVEVLRGDYVAGNLSSGTQIQLTYTSSCPSGGGIPTRSLDFLPHNSSAIITGGFAYNPNPTRRTWAYYYSELGVGGYTVAAMDEWGHIALGHFTVAG